MPTILLTGHKFSYTVNRKFIKSLSLRLKSKYSFVINCPFFTPNIFISNFINSHAGWIVKNSLQFKSKTNFSNLKNLTILGIDYQLIINKSQNDSVVIYRDTQKIFINSSSLTSFHLQALLDKKLRVFASKLIKSTLLELALQFGFKYNRVSVRNQTSRFGSCSSQGNLNFNWQIVLFPPDKFQHILLHELTHLVIKDHSPKFWAQLSLYDPNSRHNNLWLKQDGQKHFLV